MMVYQPPGVKQPVPFEFRVLEQILIEVVRRLASRRVGHAVGHYHLAADRARRFESQTPHAQDGEAADRARQLAVARQSVGARRRPGLDRFGVERAQ